MPPSHYWRRARSRFSDRHRAGARSRRQGARERRRRGSALPLPRSGPQLQDHHGQRAHADSAADHDRCSDGRRAHDPGSGDFRGRARRGPRLDSMAPSLGLDPLVIALVLLAALLHASWNAVLKVASDRVTTSAVMNLTGLAVGGVLALFFTAPGSPSWIFILLSVAIHFAYFLFLLGSYRYRSEERRVGKECRSR